MDNGLVCVAVVHEEDGLIASSFVGSPEYLQQVFSDSFQNPMIPMYYHEQLKLASITLSEFQYVYDDKVVQLFDDNCTFGFIDFINGDYSLPLDILEYVYVPEGDDDESTEDD